MSPLRAPVSDQVWITLITSVATLLTALVTAAFAFLNRRTQKEMKTTGEETHAAVNSTASALVTVAEHKDTDLGTAREKISTLEQENAVLRERLTSRGRDAPGE